MIKKHYVILLPILDIWMKRVIIFFAGRSPPIKFMNNDVPIIFHNRINLTSMISELIITNNHNDGRSLHLGSHRQARRD